MNYVYLVGEFDSSTARNSHIVYACSTRQLADLIVSEHNRANYELDQRNVYYATRPMYRVIQMPIDDYVPGHGPIDT